MSSQTPTPGPTESRPTWIRWPDGRPRVGFGGDYTPEQWPREVWKEDVHLMREAGVNLVNVAIFGWSLIEPADGVFDFSTFDEVLDLLHGADIAVDLATATASPPAWLVTAHPEIRPVGPAGEVLGFGGRQSWCPSSPLYREYSVRLTEKIAEHYADHPVLALWHVSNELGCHNARCFCDISAAHFRTWLQDRYGDVNTLNDAWGTQFWSQLYTSFEQVQPPRLAPTYPNPTQQLDFARFSSDALRDQLVAEADVLRRVSPEVPVTTNFMVMGETRNMDYAAWAADVDLVSNDHYLLEGAAEPQLELAFSADLTRGVASGRPWMVMEQSTSAVNWGHVNRPKKAGELRRNSLSQVARGADAISYFQWRQSRAGAEKYHSAMVPHAGAESRVFREVSALGADLAALEPVLGSTVTSDVALLFDWDSWWSSELDSHPSQDFRYRQVALEWYESFWRRGICVDVVPATTDLAAYRLVVVPALHLVTDAVADAVAAFAEAGGTVLVTYFSGIVDEFDHVRLGGYPGAFRDLLGVRVEEFSPLREGESVTLSDGSTAARWSEDLAVVDAEPVLDYASGSYAGQPALTRRALEHGAAWYVSTALPDATRDAVVDRLVADTDVAPVAVANRGLELVRRTGPRGRFLFAVNHTGGPLTVRTSGRSLLAGTDVGPVVEVAAGDVVVVHEAD
ncbi:beta-galactosidase [Terrabacter terrae]|uniref:Beta-galactosidase n=1 Tax=Terrabacter terrae TaxID=318434 RepID=A0ABN2UBR8_9MICO